MRNQSDSADTPIGAIDPMARHAAFFENYSASSRRFIAQTWRALEKACAKDSVAPWPLTDVAVEAAAQGRELPVQYARLLGAWAALGFPALISFLAIFYMMVARQVPFA